MEIDEAEDWAVAKRRILDETSKEWADLGLYGVRRRVAAWKAVLQGVRIPIGSLDRNGLRNRIAFPGVASRLGEC